MASDMDCLKETFRIFRRRPVLYFAAAIPPTVGMFILLYLASLATYLGLAGRGHNQGLQQAASLYLPWIAGCLLLFFFLEMAAIAAATSGIALLTWEECEGRTVSALDLAVAVGRRLFSLSVLVLIVFVGFSLACALLFLLTAHRLIAYTEIFVESYFFMLPGLLFAAYTAFAIPAATIENLGPLRALKRSFRLTRGRIIKIMGILIVSDVTLSVLGLLLMLLSLMLVAVSFLLAVLLACILVSFIFILLTLLYRKARTEKEPAQPVA